MIKKNTQIWDILKLVEPCSCTACINGCRFSSGFLAKDDKKKIAKFLNISEEELEKEYLEEVFMFNKRLFRPKIIKHKKPYGKCIFLNQDHCSIHEAKPLECRIAMPCKEFGGQLIQWFFLRYIIDPKDPECIRQWNIYLKHNKPIQGGSLEELVPDKERLKKILSFEVLR